jgi:hypothetical protein
MEAVPVGILCKVRPVSESSPSLVKSGEGGMNWL